MFAGAFVAVPEALAATLTWDGGGTDETCGGEVGDGNKWSCAANWSGDATPEATDSVVFDGTSTKDASIDTAHSVIGITIASGYVGTITQNASLSLTGDFTHNTTDGVFTWSSGTLTFGGVDVVWNVDTDDIFGDVTLNNTSTTVTSGDSAVVTGVLTLTDGVLNTGTIEVRGDFMPGENFGGGFSGGTGLINITQGVSDIDLIGGVLPSMILNADRVMNGPSLQTVIISGSFSVLNGDFVGGAGVVFIAGTLEAGLVLAAPGSLVSPSLFFVYGGWEHTDDSVFDHNNGSVSLGGVFAAAIINVNTEEYFYDLFLSVSDITAGDKLIVENNLTVAQDVSGGTVEGLGSVLNFRDIGMGMGFESSTTIQLTGTGSQEIRFLDTNNLPTTGDMNLFSGDIYINKSSGSVSVATGVNLVFDEDGQDLVIQEGDLVLAGNNLTLNGTGSTFVVEDGGNLQLQGGETLTLGASIPTLESGSTVTYTGDGDAGEDTYTLTSLEETYHHLVINSTDGATDIFQLGEALDVNGNLTVTAGTLNVSEQDYAIALAGNWSNAGTFTAQNGTVTLDGTDQTVSGDTTFYNLTKTSGGGQTLTFGDGDTQTISNSLTLQGSSTGSRLALRSTTPGTKAAIAPQALRTVRYLDVKDNDNNGYTLICSVGCQASGNNENWVFSSGSTYIAPSPGIELIAPWANQSLVANETIAITWQATPSSGEFVNIDISFDGGTVFQPLFNHLPNTGTHNWTVPGIGSDEVVLKISGTNDGAILAEYTSGSFTILSNSTSSPSIPVAEEEDAQDMHFIKTENSTTVYYVDEYSKRRPFIDEQTYFTYADSWDEIEVVTDTELAEFSLGSPALPKAGVVLVKFISSPKVYVLTDTSGQTELRHIGSEEMAVAIYGSNWADYVIDVPVTLWSKFPIGAGVDSSILVDLSTMKKRIDLHE